MVDSLPFERLVDAHRLSASLVRRTPVLTASSFSERCGGTVVLKAENLQRTGSFKLRGALNKLRSVKRGVAAGSAGNHAQSVAYAARSFGIPCVVFMPVNAAVSKIAAVHAFGAEVIQQGSSVVECVELATEYAAGHDLELVHPYDDLDVICGQAGVGLELLDDVPDLARVVVPVGGGGLAAGVCAALRSSGVSVVGVRAPGPDTIADGIAIKHPGSVTKPLLDEWLDDLVSVKEDDIAETMVQLVERSKLVVEGAGAVALAALLSGAVPVAPSGSTVAVLSGGNVDVGLLAAIARRHETRVGRRLRVYTRVRDLPGGLAGLVSCVASAGGNLVDVEHVREGVSLDVRETGVELTVETRGADHARELLDALRSAGYEPEQVGGGRKPA